jgi:hypothetical protein
MRRAGRVLAAAGVVAVALSGFTACGAAQLAMVPRAGCVIPGTHVTVPSMSGARFGGKPHSCVDGTWRPFSAKDNAR